MGDGPRPGLQARRALLCSTLGPGPLGPAVLRAGAGEAPAVEPVVARAEEWARWLQVAEAHRLASMSLSAAQAGAIEAPPDVAASLAVTALDETTTSLAAERAVLATVALLRAHDCRPALLKGASIATRFYPRVSDRPTRDVDLLLPADEVVRAWEVLTAEGYRAPLRGMDPAWVGRYAKGCTLVGPDGSEVDLHRTLTALPFGLLVDVPALWDEIEDGVVGGRPVRVLSAEATFFHTCLHAALEFEPELLAHLDVVVTSRADLDQDRVRRLVGRGPLTSVVRAAVDEAGLFGTVDPAIVDLAHALPASARGDRLLDWYRGRHRSFPATVVRAAPLVGGPVHQIKYGAAMLVGLARMAIRGRPS